MLHDLVVYLTVYSYVGSWEFAISVSLLLIIHRIKSKAITSRTHFSANGPLGNASVYPLCLLSIARSHQ